MEGIKQRGAKGQRCEAGHDREVKRGQDARGALMCVCVFVFVFFLLFSRLSLLFAWFFNLAGAGGERGGL